MKCSVKGCYNEGKFAIYEVLGKGKKVWRTNLCSQCEKKIFKSNSSIKKDNPGMVYKEVKV